MNSMANAKTKRRGMNLKRICFEFFRSDARTKADVGALGKNLTWSNAGKGLKTGPEACIYIVC
jgi:hypothetical protein